MGALKDTMAAGTLMLVLSASSVSADAPDYPAVNLQALKTMYEIAGDLVCDTNGIAQRGVIVRHMVLPKHAEESMLILKRIKDALSATVSVSLMSQYHPAHRADTYPELNASVSAEDYEMVIHTADQLGLHNGWRQYS